jgi:hypothetical protein
VFTSVHSVVTRNGWQAAQFPTSLRATTPDLNLEIGESAAGR